MENESRGTGRPSGRPGTTVQAQDYCACHRARPCGHNGPGGDLDRAQAGDWRRNPTVRWSQAPTAQQEGEWTARLDHTGVADKQVTLRAPSSAPRTNRAPRPSPALTTFTDDTDPWVSRASHAAGPIVGVCKKLYAYRSCGRFWSNSGFGRVILAGWVHEDRA
ncbi:hypothetical protein ACWD6R_40685, partial [Streptomyces sp. NPDC005151]